jgi:hypothetical protein
MTRKRTAPAQVLRYLANTSVTTWARGRGGRKAGRSRRALGYGRPLTILGLGQGSTRRRKR